MSFDYDVCDVCPYCDDFDECPLLNGASPFDCHHYTSILEEDE